MKIDVMPKLNANAGQAYIHVFEICPKNTNLFASIIFP